MRVKLLGPLEVQHNNLSATPSAPKPRQILALLALQAGHEVTTPTLVEEVWGLRPPRSANTTVHSYIRQIRRAIQGTLEPGAPRVAKEILITTGNGYQFDVDFLDIDVRRFHQLASSGRAALDGGEVDEAARLLRSALGIWRGPVLVDVDIGMRLGLEVVRLDDSKLRAHDAYIDAELRLGHHYMLLGELSMLVARYPTHEKFSGYFMLALYRSGQQWRALEVFKTLRANLRAEQGIEPSSGIQQLHQAILNTDPELDELAHRIPF